MKPSILVHICCAPDALYVMKLLKERYRVTGYFYNPNIYPGKEYQLRLEETRKVAQSMPFDLLEGDYDASFWLAKTKRFKKEPEKGLRCDICYALRLDRTARRASSEGYDYFTTVMSLSPWKKAAVLNRIGRMLGNKYKISFFESDFKKKDGFKKSVELSLRFGLYRQNYCGCIYSFQEMEKRRKVKKDRG
ncbi:MAG: epoxyqueuosine reductase QueH [Candidatus Aminicenantes bacterium]|nr:epoxyqueuosine reductase QueH [Candidatus Aminicenantes bacterium]